MFTVEVLRLVPTSNAQRRNISDIAVNKDDVYEKGSASVFSANAVSFLDAWHQTLATHEAARLGQNRGA